MNKLLKHLTFAGILLVAAATPRCALAQTTNYPDATGDTVSSGNIDITSVEVSNDAFDLIFKINFAASIASPNDWGKYGIGFSTGGKGGASPDTSTHGNGWGRAISMASGMDYWVGSWVDGGGGAQLWKSTAAWNQINTPSVSVAASNLTVHVPYGAMGLASGDSFDFDVYTTGNGTTDPAIDALSTNGQTADWGGAFQTVSNRTYAIIAPPAPTNDVFFQVDMGVPIAQATLTSGFTPGSDTVYVRGNFNAWPALPGAEYALKLQSGTVYTNTVKIVGNAGTGITYKYFIDFNSQEENRVLSCNGDVRTATLNGTSLVTPLANFGDRSLSDPTNNVTFQADMSVEIATGHFVPGTDTVYARGTFNNWGTPVTLSPLSAPDTNIYAGTLGLTNWPIGACISYKFQHDHPGAASSGYENDPNKQFTIATPNQTNTARFFNNVEPCDVIFQTNFVTFTVSMTNAVGTFNDNTVFNGSQSVFLNGDFAGWWGWNDTNSAGSNYQMSAVSGSSNYTFTVPFPPGNILRLEYKYSMNLADDEANNGQNHVRYIRTIPGQTSYTLPLDNWTGTNVNNIANLQEPKFGNLRVVPGSPGQVQVQWLGIKCVELQSAGSLGGGSWVTYTNTSGFSGTNLPTVGSQQYFRLVDPSP